MSWLALSLAILGQPPGSVPPAPSWAGGRVYSSPSLHVGVRPALDLERDGFGVGVTVQISCHVL